MKKQFLYTIGLLAVVALFSFTKKEYNPLKQSVKISENTYLEVVEVNNISWREYMSWTAKEYGSISKEYLATLPDSNVWAGEKFAPVREYYLRHEAYNDYPVVGISYEQAVAYCAWRAERVNEALKLTNKKTAVTYSYRLPTKIEWEKLAKSEMGVSEKFESKFHNLQYVTDDGVVNESDITSPIKSNMPTLNGYYNLIGNVAEMVAEQGIAKGGSWQHVDNEVKIMRDFNYASPAHWLGFRCVIETK